MNFSIIIPVYNTELFLERCLLSVQKQSFNDYEVIIVNDGSTDRSQEIIEKFAKKDPLHFKYIVQDNTGPGGARNAGIRNASGDYFLFLDSDDYIHQDTLLLGKYYLDRYGLDILKFGARIVYSDNAEEINHLPEVIPELIRYQPWDKEQFIMSANGPQSFFYSARLFLDNDLCWPEIIWYEDNAIIPVFALFADQIGRINAPLYQYYQNSSGITHSHNTQRMPEVLESADITSAYFEKYQVFQKYKDELEYRIVVQTLFSHCYRLFTAGKEIEKAEEAYHYIEEHFPLFKNNKYLKKRVKRNHEETLLLQGKFEKAWDLYYLSPVQQAEQFLENRTEDIISGDSELMLSVIIPVYNVEKYLNDCLQSVLKSTEGIPSEIILVNDGSTDHGGQICRLYKEHYARIQLIDQENCGLSAARNVGVKYARGKYIAFVDSDDFVSDTMYGKLIAAAERDHSNVAVCRVMRCYDKDSEKWVMEAIDRGFRNLTAGLMNIKETPALVYNSYVWNKLIRKDFYLKHAFSFPLGMNYEDNPVMIPMQYLAEDMSFVPDTAYYYRIRRSKSEDNLSITQDEKDNNVPDYLKSMKMTLDSLYAINTEKNVIDALIDKFISHDIYGLLNPGSIVHMMNTTLLMDQIRHTVCQCFSADDISRQNLLTQKRITAFMEGDYKKLGELNEFISAYEKTQTYSSEEHILRSLPPKLFGVQHETVIIDSLTYGPSTKLYLTDWTGENCLCHSYLYYPRISVTEKDKPEYSVFMQNLTTLEEIDLPTKSEIRCDAGNIQEISDYDQSISSFDYSGSGFSFLLNPEVSRHIPAGDRYALAVRYETPYYQGKAYLNGLSGERNLFYMDDGYIHLVQTPEKLVCLEKKEFGSMEKVSIIVPVYNAEKHFERFIRCIRKQTYVNLEVLLIDDGSTDGSAALCDRYAAEDARIRAIHLPHAGVARARNRGLEEYTGKYLMFADIDDLLAKNYVSRLYELITHSEEHVVTCIAHDTRKTDLQKYEYKGKKQKPKRHIWGTVNYRTRESHRVIWGAIYDRYAVEGIRFDEQYVVSTDTLFFAEVLRHIGSHLHVNEELYCYVMYDSSLSHRRPDRNKYDDIRVWKRIYEILPETGTSHNSCQTLILEKTKRYLTNILKSEPVDMQLYRDICADIKQTDLGPLVMKNRKDRIKNRMFLAMPDLYMKLRRTG